MDDTSLPLGHLAPQPASQAGLVPEIVNYNRGVVASNPVGQGGQNSPFIFNPQTGQLVQNPGYLNALQSFQLQLDSNPDLAAHIGNLKQLATIVPTEQLSYYRGPNGEMPPTGITFSGLIDGGYTTFSDNSQANVGLHNQANILQQASDLAGANTLPGGGVTGAIMAFLGKLGLSAGQPANQYQQLYGQLQPQYQAALPAFGNAPTAATGAALGNLRALSGGATQPLPSSAMHPMTQAQNFIQNPYQATQPAMLNPAQLGANAQAANGL